MLDLCVSAKLRLLNGRFIGDLLGNVTCINERGCSVVDYAVASESLLSSVNYYIFKNPSYFSDHNQIATHLKCYGKVMNTNDQLEKFNFEYRWTKASKQLLENELMESYLYENLTRFQETKFENSQQTLNKATEIISDIYIKLSDKCMKKRNF